MISTARIQEPRAAAAKPRSSAPRAVLQRKCACGKANDEECTECKAGKRLQPKLAIGAGNHPLEHEADRIAEQVMTPSPRSPAASVPVQVQRLAGESASAVPAAPASVERTLADPGNPLDPALGHDMGQRFGHDFSRVRVHTGPAAADSARDIGARAYAAGHHLVFGTGQYQPSTRDGQRLLAHELTHVLQQEHGTPRTLRRAPADCTTSKRADVDADIVAKAGKAANDAQAQQELYLALKRARACFPDFDEAAFLALVPESQKLYPEDLRKAAAKGHPTGIAKDDRKLAWAESLKPFAGYFLSGFDTANRLLVGENKRRIGGTLAPSHKPFRDLADKQGESTKHPQVKKAFSEASVLVFSGHQYAQYRLPGVWNTGDWDATLDVRGITDSLPNVKIVISTSCATLCKEAYDVWKTLFPNAVFLGAARSTPLNGARLANAFVNNLPRDMLFDNGAGGVSGAISAWKSAVEKTQTSAVRGGVLNIAAGTVELWNGRKWESGKASDVGNKCKVKADWSAEVPDPRAAAAASGATDDPLPAAPAESGPSAREDAGADQAQELAGAPKVDRIKLITGKSGAFQGFPVVGEVDLNAPGAFNETKSSGTCVNIHQMQFHLSRGEPMEVKLVRKIVRVASAGGKQRTKGEKNKPADDGPSAPTVIRQRDASSIVVSDAPGFVGKGDASKSNGVFPVTYDADFDLHAIDFVSPRLLATFKYSVSISKSSYDDANPKNEIKEKSRKLF